MLVDSFNLHRYTVNFREGYIQLFMFCKDVFKAGESSVEVQL
jgi:hypothetical protein